METFQYAAQGHEGDQCILGSLQNFRFKKNKRMSINPPSITLHITNIVKQVCYDDYYVRQIFSQYGTVQKVIFRFLNQNVNMCLVKMSSMEESLLALAYLHNFEIHGRYLFPSHHQKNAGFLHPIEDLMKL